MEWDPILFNWRNKTLGRRRRRRLKCYIEGGGRGGGYEVAIVKRAVASMEESRSAIAEEDMFVIIEMERNVVPLVVVM